MVEKVLTGGIKEFNYGKGYNPKLDEKRAKEIDEAYAKADERKRKEKNRRMAIIVIIIAIIIILGISFYFLYK